MSVEDLSCQAWAQGRAAKADCTHGPGTDHQAGTAVPGGLSLRAQAPSPTSQQSLVISLDPGQDSVNVVTDSNISGSGKETFDVWEEGLCGI